MMGGNLAAADMTEIMIPLIMGKKSGKSKILLEENSVCPLKFLLIREEFQIPACVMASKVSSSL
jgi:hypothetical protein